MNNFLATHSQMGISMKLAGQRGLLFGGKAATVGQGFAAPDAGPQTAVGKAVVGFGVTEVIGEVALGDMTHDADMRRSGLDVTMAVISAQSPPSQAQRSKGESWPVSRPSTWMTDANSSESRKSRAIGGGLLIA
jgi:hypothetical protein